MDANLDIIAKELYGKIQTRFPDIEIGDEAGEVLSKKTDIPKARFFEFVYNENDVPLGTVVIILDKDDGIVVQAGSDLVNDEDGVAHKGAYKFIRSFKNFARDRLLKFKMQRLNKSQLEKRDYQYFSQRKEDFIMENKLYGTSRMSYQDLGEAQLIIKHNQPVNMELPAGRTMHVDSIYIENSQGERFRFPSKNINGARALAEHIKAGGNPYDSIGTYIISLSEELGQLRKFKNYVGRQEQISEAMGDITSKVMERIDQVKKEILSLQRPTYYRQFAESFEEHLAKDIPEDIMNDWVDRLTIRTFNEELKSVFPYIYKLVDESDIPVKELTADDILGEDGDEGNDGYCDACDRPSKDCICDDKVEESFLELEGYENFIESMVNEEGNGLFSPNRTAQNDAINKFKEIMQSPMLPGEQGIDPQNSLKGIIDDPELNMLLKDAPDNVDVRGAIGAWLLANKDKFPDPNVIDQLDLDQMGKEGSAEIPPPEPVAAPEPAAAPEAMPPAPEEAAPAPVAEDDMPDDHPQKFSPVEESAIVSALRKARKAGATLETKLDFGHGVKSIQEIIEDCGCDPQQLGYSQYGSGYEQLKKFAQGFWNKEEKNFPRGGQWVKIHIKKAFDDGQFPNASEDDLHAIIRDIEHADPSTDTHDHEGGQQELGHILKLANVHSAPQEQPSRESEQTHNTLNGSMKDLIQKMMGL
jgi:hypothetical protein